MKVTRIQDKYNPDKVCFLQYRIDRNYGSGFSDKDYNSIRCREKRRSICRRCAEKSNVCRWCNKIITGYVYGYDFSGRSGITEKP